jgi:hypothetical protein
MYWGDGDRDWGLLYGMQMPELPPGQWYACWWVYEDGTTLPCGRLVVGARGTGDLEMTIPRPRPAGMRVTRETGPVSAPMGPIVVEGAPAQNP